MKKIILTLVIISFLFCALSVSAQEEDLAAYFPKLICREQNDADESPEYYRFPTDRLNIDPYYLSRFPLERENWVNSLGMIERARNNGIYTQMIYLNTPAENTVTIGTSLGGTYGFLNDFYFSADLYVTDEYPADTGSCYIVYANTPVIGYENSAGVLIDPETGIYEYHREQDSFSSPSLLVKFDPAAYKDETGSFGNAIFTRSNLDKKFEYDSAAVADMVKKDGTGFEVKTRRMELLRRDGMLTVYINGLEAGKTEDPVTGPVGWSYGPLLNQGGITTTVALGDLSIYGN